MATIHLPTIHSQSVARNCQQGVGLLEVLVALFIFALGALALASMQASAISMSQHSSSHLALDSIGRAMSEHIKANPARAGRGDFDTLFSEVTVDVSKPEAGAINAWKSRVNALLQAGATQIQCTTSTCQISIRWDEYTGSASTQQQYNLSVPFYDH